jgi:DNA helicase HerA-like ATPase
VSARPGAGTSGSFFRVLDLPRVTDLDHRSDTVSEQLRLARGALLPVLAGAHAAAETVIVAWVHHAADADMRIVVGGGITAATGGAGSGELLYPPGAHGQRLADGDGMDLLRSVPYWARCGGVIDTLAAGEREPRERPDAVFDDYVAALLGIPFGWLVVADPQPRATTDEHLRVLSRGTPRLRELAANSETHRVALERAEGRFRELSRGSTAGLWRVHVLAGGADPASALRIAGLLGSAADVGQFPYRMLPGDKAMDFNTTWETVTEPELADGPASPFLAASDFLAAIARPPVKELPGIRLTPASSFDVTPEHRGGIFLGTVLDRGLRPAAPLEVAEATLNRHVFVCGATGSGKSQTIRALLERLAEAGVPWLVIEPAKAEYAGMAGRVGDASQVLVIRPGQPDEIPAGLNPLEPEPGFPLQTHLDLIRALFMAAFEAHDPLPQVLGQALARCYTALGWNLALGESRHAHATPRYPELGDLRSAARAVVDEIGYSDRITSDVRGFIDVRIGSLQMGTPGRFFQGGHRLDVADLLNRNTVLELEDIGNDQDKAFFIGTVLIRVAEHLRQRHAASRVPQGLRHVTVIEEAHRLLKRAEPGTPAAHAVELFAALLAEIRAYGEGIVVAEQIPGKITSDVIKNTALKIVHRLPAADDRDVVGATMNLGPRDSQYVVTLPPGLATVFADGMDHPVLARIPLGEAREDSDRASRAAGIEARRSPACGTSCEQRPCTLREIDGGARVAGDAELALWIELLTIAHVIGRPGPLPSRSWLARLAARGSTRTMDCAVGQLAHSAVDRRYPRLIEHFQPEELACHVADRARGWLAGDDSRCDGTETRWQAGSYRWADVIHALAQGDHEPGKPHPLTDSWRRRGLDLTSLPAARQLDAMIKMPSSWDRDRTAIEGNGQPPEHVRLCAVLSQAEDPITRFEQAARFLAFTTDWPFRHLYRGDWAAYLERSRARE